MTRKEKTKVKSRFSTYFGLSLVATVSVVIAPLPAAAQTAAKKPNILVMFGDDIGYWNISAYNRGMMGYRTPSIDRIAREGAIFTDNYAQQSCTAGRAAFVTGQSPIRPRIRTILSPSGSLRPCSHTHPIRPSSWSDTNKNCYNVTT